MQSLPNSLSLFALHPYIIAFIINQIMKYKFILSYIWDYFEWLTPSIALPQNLSYLSLPHSKEHLTLYSLLWNKHETFVQIFTLWCQCLDNLWLSIVFLPIYIRNQLLMSIVPYLNLWIITYNLIFLYNTISISL